MQGGKYRVEISRRADRMLLAHTGFLAVEGGDVFIDAIIDCRQENRGLF
jgi:hypothetical protein